MPKPKQGYRFLRTVAALALLSKFGEGPRDEERRTVPVPVVYREGRWVIDRKAKVKAKHREVIDDLKRVHLPDKVKVPLVNWTTD